METNLSSHSPFILHPSSLILSLVSAKEPLNVRIICSSQALVCAAEDDVAFAHHQHLAVNQAEALAFFLEYDLALFIDDCVFRAKVVEVVHFVRDKDGRDIFQ